MLPSAILLPFLLDLDSCKRQSCHRPSIALLLPAHKASVSHPSHLHINPYCELHLLEQNVVLSDLLSGFPFWPSSS